MTRKTLMLPLAAVLASLTLSPQAAFAQFPPPPPMAGPPPIAAGGPPPLAAGAPPAFAARPPIGLGSTPHAGLGGGAPRLGAGPAAPGNIAGVRRGGPANATRAGSAGFGGYGRYDRLRYGYRGAYAASAYAGAAAGYAYGRGYSSDGDCYYTYTRQRRVLVCD